MKRNFRIKMLSGMLRISTFKKFNLNHEGFVEGGGLLKYNIPKGGGGGHGMVIIIYLSGLYNIREGGGV